MIINEKATCRVCDSPVHLVVDFGKICINDFPQSSQAPTSSAPMVLDQCEKCDLVQLRHTVDPKVLYGEHYWYESGLNPKLKSNLHNIADIINEHTDANDTVLDIGANDGSLLEGVKDDRVRVGCEPAPNLWEKLKSSCDIMIPEMWDHKYLDQYICTHPSTEYINNKAKAITAIGMFYDMDNPNDFISSVKEALTDDGIFIAQLMTLAPMLRMRDLGNVCHEHLEYYSYASLVELYERNGLEIYHVEENDIQGGSYQLWARHLDKGSIQYDEDISTLKHFFAEIEHNGKVLRDTLETYKDKNCYVYGASTKGNTMLQLWKLGKYFKGAAEIHPGKVGRVTVGTNIPIVHEDDAKQDADLFFVPNFGFKDMFVEKEKEWIDSGGTMVFAMPNVEVINHLPVNNIYFSEFASAGCYDKVDGIIGSKCKGKVNKYYTRTKISEEQLLQKKHILFIGDSFTYGHGLKADETISAWFETLLDNDEYYVINLGTTATSIEWSVTRLQQWCNTFSENIHAVYFGVPPISRRTHWQKVLSRGILKKVQQHDGLEFLDNYLETDAYSNIDDNYRFDFLSGSIEREKIIKSKYEAFITLSSKINDIHYCEQNLNTLKQKAMLYNFNVYIHFIFIDTLLSEQEVLKNNLENNNINSDIDIKVKIGHSYVASSPHENYKLKDGHWNSKGCERMASVLLEDTKKWFL